MTFLGRGGSDTTAVALAHGLDADACELYTDVPGVFTTDPRVSDQARKLSSISFDELLEMTAVGCPKPAMRSVEVARSYGVRLPVRSAFTWETGTWVSKEKNTMEKPIISAVVPDTSQSKVTISGVPDNPGIAAAIFRPLADQDVNVDMIVQNTSDEGVTDISFTLPTEQLDIGTKIMSEAAQLIGAAGVSTDDTIGRVSVVGAGMASNPGVAATIFETLSNEGINIGRHVIIDNKCNSININTTCSDICSDNRLYLTFTERIDNSLSLVLIQITMKTCNIETMLLQALYCQVNHSLCVTEDNALIIITHSDQ